MTTMITIAQQLEEVVKRSSLFTFKETDDFRIYEIEPWYGGIINKMSFKEGAVVTRNTSFAVREVWHDKNAITEIFTKDRIAETDSWVQDQRKEMTINVRGFRFSKKYNSAQAYTYVKGWYEKRDFEVYFKTTRIPFITVSDSIARISFLGNRNRKTIRVLSLKNAHSLFNDLYYFKSIGLDKFEDKYDFVTTLLSPMMGPVGLRTFQQMITDDDGRTLIPSSEMKIPIFERKAYIGATSEEDLLRLSIGKEPARRLVTMFKDDPLQLVKIYKCVRVDQMTKFQQVLYTIPKDDLVVKQDYWYGDHYSKLFRTWYMHYLKAHKDTVIVIGKDSFNVENVVRDYLHYIEQSKRKLNLNIGPRRMKAIHDDYHRIARAKEVAKGPKLKPRKEYEVLRSTPEFTVEFIKDKMRLCAESDMMNHCVYSYSHKINRGECGIYSILYQSKRYTCELGLTRERNFYINQIRGYGNSMTPRELEDAIKTQLYAKNQNCSDQEFAIISQNPMFVEQNAHNVFDFV